MWCGYHLCWQGPEEAPVRSHWSLPLQSSGMGGLEGAWGKRGSVLLGAWTPWSSGSSAASRMGPRSAEGLPLLALAWE